MMIPVFFNGLEVGEIENQVDVGDKALILFNQMVPKGHHVLRIYVMQDLKGKSSIPKTINIMTEPYGDGLGATPKTISEIIAAHSTSEDSALHVDHVVEGAGPMEHPKGPNGGYEL
jgi:hypothetical protein